MVYSTSVTARSDLPGWIAGATGISHYALAATAASPPSGESVPMHLSPGQQDRHRGAIRAAIPCVTPPAWETVTGEATEGWLGGIVGAVVGQPEVSGPVRLRT
jgi:hypothetical protein